MVKQPHNANESMKTEAGAFPVVIGEREQEDKKKDDSAANKFTIFFSDDDSEENVEESKSGAHVRHKPNTSDFQGTPGNALKISG